MSDYGFNMSDKVTKEGGDYAGYGGPVGNFSQKDASIDRLKESNKKGQVICHYEGTHELSIMRTNNGGGTAYNGNPVAEVYECATSNKVASADAVEHKVKVKSNKA